ncbi:MAG: class I SAM-dependent methyltransferase [Gammaproteobacteria bacterium]
MSDAVSTATPSGHCPWCNGTQATTLHRIGAWDIRRCATCGLARIDPYPTPESRPAFYSAEAIEDRRVRKRRGIGSRLAAWIRHWLRRLSGRSKGTLFLRELARRKPPGATVLDIGCGTGAFLRDARAHYRCTGIEISDHLADAARKLGVEVVVGNFCEYPFGTRRFDAITMISLIEHLHTPREALARCHALLEDGGVLLLKTVNHGGLNRRLLGARWSGYRPPDHLVYFDPETLRQALRETGFRDVTVRAAWFNDSFYCFAVK